MSSSRKRRPPSEDGEPDADSIGHSTEVCEGSSSKRLCMESITCSDAPAQILLPEKLEDRVHLLQQDGDVPSQASDETEEVVEPAQTDADTPASSATPRLPIADSTTSSDTPSPNPAKDLGLTGATSPVPDLPDQLQPISGLSPKQDSPQPESQSEDPEIKSSQGISLSPKIEDTGTSKSGPKTIEEDMYLDPEDEEAKFERATIDDKSYVTNWTVDENSLARMPAAPQPARIKTRLLLHQLQALHWMQGKEHPELSEADSDVIQFWEPKNGGYTHIITGAVVRGAPPLFSGGILADDMGLGKTLEMIALTLAEPAEKPTLIVAPLGVMSNWESQIAKHAAPDPKVQALRYHGKGCEATIEELESSEIVITSYSILARETKLQEVAWRRVILDEGHFIRNPGTQTAKAACKLEADSYWVCTGTPIINTLKDVYSIAKFIGVKGGLECCQVFTSLMRKNHQLLQIFMTTICLRRTKRMQFVNLRLPPKTEEVVRINFTHGEYQMYRKLLESALKVAAHFFRTGDYEVWRTLFERILRLRQMCNHRSLCKTKIERDLKKELLKLISKKNPSDSDLQEALRLSVEANGTCASCQEALELHRKPVMASCLHVFCDLCLQETMKYSLRCPSCKKLFDKTRVIRLDVERASAASEAVMKGHSSKTKALLSILEKRLARKGSKIVVFSQWTSFLDLVARHLLKGDIRFSRIDGTMSTGERDKAVQSLKRDKNVRVMLASLRVAGVGIDLTAADTAILADTWWAPAVEEQAIDRVHRLGQKRSVQVFRLVMKNAIEEKILMKQDTKRELAGTALQEGFKRLMSADDVKRMVKILLEEPKPELGGSDSSVQPNSEPGSSNLPLQTQLLS